MSAERRDRPENILALTGTGIETELTDNQESVWQDVVKRVDEVYSDLLRYEADLERKNAELEEAQCFISSVIASVSDILIVCDDKGQVLQANPAFVALLGRAENELAGLPLQDLIVAEDREQARRCFCTGDRGEGRSAVTDCELRFLGAQGPSDMMAINFSGRFDHSGHCVGAVLTGRPIGELRRAYQALHKAHLDLQQAQRKLIEQEKMASLGRLVAGVAHELNNPISFVYGNVHVLDRYRKTLADYFAEEARRDDSDASELRRKYRVGSILADLEPLIEGTLEGAKRISEIVKNLRRISFNRAHEAQRIDVERLLTTATQWSARAKKNHAVIDLDVAPGLVVWGNEGQIHQIVVNLIDNAIDAVRASKKPHIEVRAAAAGGEIEISVADNGPGIADVAFDKMFEPFFTTKTVGEGTGLGLWISYAIAREHGGSISAANREHGGAIFILRLPVGG
ncbi:PAS domain S-box protein [Rhodoblastus acidophilus]|uniref:histidine kinase n=1 Tax=Candidatus Rhodoblastus alkanivorans TaxID=2954117 RepID=A0ABS9Z2B9_9HYPH|nr:ATP-binding protein [Candidatus Rhodoblastus alkanivorans]MCI4677460.1 PAS domain S-box protein [Candidatus Rhodoblastus alkanivorans]MCI4681819.1 PAS domain S-box protein [Candidatus Rhodoblastus alkanivorans]MDI4642869.1 PAS domain S-box protein [Rhodoblastus acidophilus]